MNNMPMDSEWLTQTFWINLAGRTAAFLLVVVVGYVVKLVISEGVRGSLRRSRHVSDMLERFTLNVLGKCLWAVIIVVALSNAGVDVGPLIAGLGVAGFVIGFAFQETLGNLAAGFMIMLNQPFKQEDYVEVAGVSGTVKEVNMMATTIMTPDNKRIVIPNSKVWGQAVVNYTAMDTRRIDLVIGVSYDADIGTAVETARAVLTGDERVFAEPAPMIVVGELADSSVNLLVRPWCATGDYWPLRWELTRRIKEAFDEAGVVIPYPQVDVHHFGQEKPETDQS